MKRLHWTWWLALVLLTLLFMLARLPASLLSAVLASQTSQQFNLAAASGTLWHGSAQPVLAGQALTEKLEWQWRPKDLLKATLGFDITLDSGKAQLGLRPGLLQLRDADLTLAAGPLLAMSERTRPYGLTGQFRLASPSLDWRPQQAEGQLSLDWRNASSSLVPSVRPLGDYRLNLMPAGSGWQLQLSTLSGALLLNGGGQWQMQQGLQAEVSLQAAPGSGPALLPFLNQVGEGGPESPRQLRFQFR